LSRADPPCSRKRDSSKGEKETGHKGRGEGKRAIEPEVGPRSRKGYELKNRLPGHQEKGQGVTHQKENCLESRVEDAASSHAPRKIISYPTGGDESKKNLQKEGKKDQKEQ